MRSSIEGLLMAPPVLLPLVAASPPPPPVQVPPESGGDAHSASMETAVPDEDVSVAAPADATAAAGVGAAAAAVAATHDPTKLPPTLRRPCCVVLGVVALRAEACCEFELLLLFPDPPELLHGVVFVVKAFWDEEVSCECCCCVFES